jgi:hypothetical protein
MPRITNLRESGVLAADNQLKVHPGDVFSITLCWKGLTVGDLIATLRDSATGVGGGHDEVVFIAPTANGTFPREWSQGKRFDTGIFFNVGPMPAGGTVYAELTFK